MPATGSGGDVVGDLICDSCGERNPLGTEFCLACNAYLAWDRTMAPGLPTPGPPAPSRPVPQVGHGPVQPGPPGPPTSSRREDPAGESLRVVADQSAITLTPGRDAVVLTLTVFNASRIVDRYLVDIPDAPTWLSLSADELRLAPQTDDKIRATLRIPAPPMVAVGQHQLTVRVRSATATNAVWTAPLALTVGVIDAPMLMTIDPVLSRVRDQTDARVRLLLDNRNSNRPIPLSLSGNDSEGILRFRFQPAQLVVPPMGTATALLQLSGPLPAPGQEATRTFTVTGLGGIREVTAIGTFVTASSAQVLKLAVEPNRQSVRDTGGAEFRLTAEHPGGIRPVRLAFRGQDPDRQARFTFFPPVLDLAPGAVGYVRVHVEVPQPEPGQELTRELTFTTAVLDSPLTASAAVSLVQRTTPPSLTLRLEPAVIRVRDSSYARTQLIADNRTSVRPVRLMLGGADPELAIRFHFTPPVLELAAGEAISVMVDLAAPLPEQGSEVSRQFTVRASDPHRAVDVTGTLTQSASEPAISDLALRLEPPVYRLHGRRTGSLLVVADNRSGSQPVQIYWQGSDAEGEVHFAFEPTAVVVPPGGTAASRVTVSAPSPPGGAEKTRSITITGSDGRLSTQATGSFIQSGSDQRPLWSVILTVLGALMMIAGVFLPWIVLPEQETGLELSLVEFARFTHIDLARLNLNIQVLQQIPRQLISAGIVVLLFAAVQLFGLTGKTGRLIRTGAGLTFVFVVGFILALVFRSGGFQPGVGSVLVGVGALAGFVGGLLARK